MLKQKMLEIGYNTKDIDKILNTYPVTRLKKEFLYTKVDKIFKFLLDFGYTRKETLKIIEIFPAILGYSKTTIKRKIEDIMKLGYNNNNVILITKKFPAIYSLSIENLKEKKEFYDNIEISNFILNDPKNLMQSIDLSYARYMFYKSIDNNITMNNYKLLFISNNQFKNKYGLSNDTLIKKYNYKTKKLVKRCI